MIRMITENDIPILKTMSRKDLFLSRILCNYEAYGKTNIADFWVQTQEGRLNNVLCRVDDVMTICHVSDGNSDELDGFLYAVGVNTVLCDGNFADAHFPGLATTGPILHYDNREMLECDFAFRRNPPLKELYQILKNVTPIPSKYRSGNRSIWIFPIEFAITVRCPSACRTTKKSSAPAASPCPKQSTPPSWAPSV